MLKAFTPFIQVHINGKTERSGKLLYTVQDIEYRLQEYCISGNTD